MRVEGRREGGGREGRRERGRRGREETVRALYRAYSDI